MFKIFIDGNDDRLRLENQIGEKIGWIHAHTIGFGGINTEADAIAIAVDASQMVQRTLQRVYTGDTTSEPWPNSKIHLMHDGAYEWIVAGRRPLARLLRPHTERNAEDTFALEFLVPSYATQHVTIAVAHAIWDVLSSYAGANELGEAFATAIAGGR
jgi:hypothetical protein